MAPGSTAPSGTVAVAGTLTTPFEDRKFTVTPPLGAGSESCTCIVVDPPPAIVGKSNCNERGDALVATTAGGACAAMAGQGYLKCFSPTDQGSLCSISQTLASFSPLFVFSKRSLSRGLLIR